MKPYEIRGLDESLKSVRKVFFDTSIDLDGNVIIYHHGIKYGIRTEKYRRIPCEVPIEQVIKTITREIINLVIREITHETKN